MAYVKEHNTPPHSRPSFAMVDGGYVRPGSWGHLPHACKTIEDYKKGNRPCGPFTVDHVPGASGGIFKVFYNDKFIRYADDEDIEIMARALREGREGDFEEYVRRQQVINESYIMGHSKRETDEGDELFEAFGGVTPKRKSAVSDPLDLEAAFGGVGTFGDPPPKRQKGDVFLHYDTRRGPSTQAPRDILGYPLEDFAEVFGASDVTDPLEEAFAGGSYDEG
jgi:hypothetical protein